MARYGYSYVTDRGFASFARELSEGAWADVSIEPLDDGSDAAIAASSLLDAPLVTVWKLRATWAIRTLLRAIGTTTADELLRLDAEWDSAQRALNLALLTETEHPDAARRAGADRMRSALLLGAGTGQTNLSYDKEVDFGLAQLDLAADTPLAADVAAAGLLPHLDRIRAATDALAAGLGRSPGESRTLPRTQRIREALAGCSQAFNAIHGALEWCVEHTAAGPDREQLEALRAPFLALLERYPPRARTAEEEVGAEVTSDDAAVDDEPGELAPVPG